MTLSKAFSAALLVYLCQIEAGKAQSANLPNQGANVFHPTPSTQSGQFAQDSAANMVPGETSLFEEQLRPTLSALVSSNDFDALEKIADGLRISKAQTTDGTWHLLSFYRVLSKLPDKTTHGQWDERIAFLNKWTSAKPDSITARVALAECYKNCAWSERGYGYADTVSVGGWQLFSRGLEQAKQVLTDAKKLKAKCPMWWDTMQFVALGLEFPQSEYDKIFSEAIAFEPNYTFFYNNKVVYLLPRWYGREGDWQRFASQCADKMGGEEGDILYARIGWRVHQRRIYDGFIRDSGYSWPRMKKGLETIVKKSPESTTALNELAYLSYQAKDRASAQFAFAKIGSKMDSEIWNSDKARFQRVRAWAVSQ